MTLEKAAPSDIRIGGIPLPAFVILCFFGPFALSLVVFVVYHYTQRYKEKKEVASQRLRLEEGQKDIELQVRDLVEQPQPPVWPLPAPRTFREQEGA